MPIDFTSYVINVAGRAEIDPEQSMLGKQSLYQGLGRIARDHYQLVDLPDLPKAEAGILREHSALYERVAENAIAMIEDSGFRHKKSNFDYSIGPGLQFLKAQTGADKLLFLSAAHERSSSGRTALEIVGAAIFLWSGARLNIVPDRKDSRIVVGEVDLETGAVIWLNFGESSEYGDLRDLEVAKETIYYLFEPYPLSQLIESVRH